MKVLQVSYFLVPYLTNSLGFPPLNSGVVYFRYLQKKQCCIYLQTLL